MILFSMDPGDTLGVRFRFPLSHPDSRSDPNDGSEPSSGRETIYWDSLPVFFFFFFFCSQS